MTFGNQLSNLLKLESITQQHLSRELHISPSTLNGYLQNKRQPDHDTLLHLATYFGTTTDFLLGHCGLSAHSQKNLSTKELELILLFRCINESGQKLLMDQAQLIWKYHKRQ